MPGSVASSRASNTSGRYRRVANTSQVDESLFGSQRSTSSVPGGVITQSKVSKWCKKAPAQTVVISHKELSSIRNLVRAPKPTEVTRTKTCDLAPALQGEERRRKAQERKDRIKAIDRAREERHLLQQAASGEISTENLTPDVATTAKDEELDEVKHMNEMILYAKCMTIRDAQLREKEELKKQQEDEERRLDEMMERERKKAQVVYKEREVARMEERKTGAEILRQQIEDRERKRMLERELKDQEQEHMLQHIEKLKEEEHEEAHRRTVHQTELMEEVAKANQDAIVAKQRQREAEIEEDSRIAEYIKERDRVEAERQAEMDRIKAEKEREVARLRALQEKASDKQAELDALRARRAQEAYERDWRSKEKEAAERRHKMELELQDFRERQAREKEQVLAEQSRIEKEEFENIVKYQKQQERLEQERIEAEVGQRSDFGRDLKSQMEELVEKRRAERLRFIEDGRRLSQQEKEQQMRLERIRQSKLQELEEAGVPAKYRVELATKKLQRAAL